MAASSLTKIVFLWAGNEYSPRLGEVQENLGHACQIQPFKSQLKGEIIMNLRVSRLFASILAATGLALSFACASATAANPGAAVEQPLRFQAYDNPKFPTFAFGMEKHGTVVGYYYNANYNALGFLRTADGGYTDVVYPKTPTSTFAQAINNAGNVAGYGQIAGVNGAYGWFYDAASKAFTAIEVPHAQATDVWGLNNQNVVAGAAYFYTDSTGRGVGFTWTNGTFKYYKIPDAQFTQIYAINDNGDVAGSYIETSGASHDFIWKADGTVSILDPVNEFNNMAGVAGLNKNGDFVGPCYDQDFNTMGCFYKRSTAKVTSFKLDGFSSTMPSGMSHGDIVGYGIDATSGIAQAFVIPKSSVLGK